MQFLTEASPIILLTTVGYFFLLFVDAQLGWRAAAQRYRATKPPPTSPYRRGTVRVGDALLAGQSFSIEPSINGILIDPPLLLRLFHPPLLILWKELTKYKASGGGLFDGAYLIFDLPNGPRIKISPNAAALEKIIKCFPGNLADYAISGK